MLAASEQKTTDDVPADDDEVPDEAVGSAIRRAALRNIHGRHRFDRRGMRPDTR
jgi:hypothetical protein